MIEVAKSIGVEINRIFFEKLRIYEMTAIEEMAKRREDGDAGK